MGIHVARRVVVFLVSICVFTAVPISVAAAHTALPEDLLCTDRGGGSWVDTASAMFRDGKVDEAEDIYRAVLAVDPTDECAVKGMAAVADAAAVDDAKKKAGRPFTGRVADDWSAAVTTYFAPLGPPLLAVLAIVLLLLVLSRLVTPLAVRPQDRAWPDGWRTFFWALGFVLLVAAAAAPIVASGLPSTPVPHPAGVLFIGSAAAALVALLWRSVSKQRSLAGARLWWSGLAAAAVTALLDAALLFVDPLRTWWTVLITASVVFGGLGVALVAMTRGQALRLTIEVLGASGTPDGNAARYVLGRLGELGSEPPSGLEAPEQTDVTELPKDALAALPEAALAKAMFRVLQAVRPPIPWRVTIGIHGSTTVTVSLTRNGRPSGTVASFSRKELHLPPPAADGATTNPLLTAAAAHILVVLAEHHPKLAAGLCGATDSRSLAMHAIAMDPSGAVDPGLRESLLTAAVAADPMNALARVSDLNRLGKSATVADQRIAANAAKHELILFWNKTKGYEALRLRLRFIIAATRVNVVLLDANQNDSDRDDAVTALTNFVTALAEEPKKPLRQLVDDLRQAAYFLVRSGDLATNRNERLKSLLDTVKPWLETDAVPLKGPVAYDRACWLVTDHSAPDWQRRAMEDLRLAVTDQQLRVWARQDPSLANLRSDPEWRDRFRTLVCDAPTEFLGIAGIAPYREELRRIGVTDEFDLMSMSPVIVARKLRQPLSRTRRWADLAALVIGDPRTKAMPVGLVDALAQMNVYSRDDLDNAIDNLGANATPDLALFLPLNWDIYLAPASTP